MMANHVILFLAANPHGSSARRLSEECSEIQREIKLAAHRDDFRFEARWAVGIDELLRHLNELDPAVIHFSGHGDSTGVMLQDEQGRPQLVSPRALAMMIGAAARNVRVVVLNACYSAQQAEALRAEIDCVIGMDGSIGDAAARAFAIRFYGALASRRSVGNAVAQAVAALAARQLPEEAAPRCVTRDGIDADALILSAPTDLPHTSTSGAVVLGSSLESLRASATASPRTTMTKHTILFLAANPLGTDQRALDREARAIQVELDRSGRRDQFELVTRWAAQPQDLLRELRKLKPTVVHFSGHGGISELAPPGPGTTASELQRGLYFESASGRPQLISTEALEEVFGAAGSSVRLVVLSACYSEAQAEALLSHVDCVVGMSGAITDDATRGFAVGFYGGLGEGESVAQAFRQGRAGIGLEGLRESDRPQLKVRRGVAPDQLVLAALGPSSPTALDLRAGFDTQQFILAALTAQHSTEPALTAPAGRSQVDIGILTIREDEFGAVLAAFPADAGTREGAHRVYALRHADAGNDDRYLIAILRQIEQGNGEAQDAARDMIEDLDPKLVLVVGIAGGVPSDDVKLGDVVLSTRIQDFTVEARKAKEKPTYASAGGLITKALATRVTNLAGQTTALGDWTRDLPPQPAVSWTKKGELYGPVQWQSDLRSRLKQHYGNGGTLRAPAYVAGTIASSDKLVKDPEVLIPWLTTARTIKAVEMESGGVYRAARERCPMLAIRGISDIIGLKRAEAWTKFACASAAAFTQAFLRTRPVPPGPSIANPS